MVLPICGLCGSEAVLLVIARALGVPDSVFFLLLGALVASLGFWTHKILKNGFNLGGWHIQLNIRHQVKIIVLAYIAVAVLSIWLSGNVGV